MKTIICFLIALLISGHALAVGGVSAEWGTGQNTRTARIGVQWSFHQSWFTEKRWHVTGFWEANAGTWQGHSAAGGNQTITDLGITPVFRLQQASPSGISPYLEGAIGFHLISPTYISNNRKFGSAFEFGDHVGLGATFGEKQQFDLGYRFQHLSNAGIKMPNQGINLSQVHFSYRF
jgi:hypothetical protein